MQSGARHAVIRSIMYAPVCAAVRWIVSLMKASVNIGKAGYLAKESPFHGSGFTDEKVGAIYP